VKQVVRFVVGAVAVAACGGGVKPPPDRQVVLAGAVSDETKLAAMLRGSVTNGGLWFEDATCASKFEAPGEIKEDQLATFAHCLVELKLQRSAREDALGDVVVMTYAPGFEVEARVVNENDGARLTWIGFESLRPGDVFPTVTAGALEALRVAGSPDGPVDKDLAAVLRRDPTPTSSAEYTWFKLCIDEAGNVASVKSYETTSLAATKVFEDALSKWQFRPFTIEGQPVPVCAMVRPAYPPGLGPRVETIPLPPAPSRGKRDPIVFAEGAVRTFTEGKRIRGSRLITPDNETKTAIAESGVRKLTGTFRLCIDDSGKVESVLPLRSTGFASYDRRLLGAMMQWQYSPYMADAEPIPVCTTVTFIYTQR
jgi:hypothetical protein